MAVSKMFWGYHEQHEIYLVTLINGGIELSVTNLGCTIVSLKVPVSTGGMGNVVLGYDSLQGYIGDRYYTGCIIGRFANRVSGAKFSIGDTHYRLAANETGSGNHLHGGTAGFNKKVFSVSGIESDNAIQFYYGSPDGEEGYPGNLDIFITYRLTEAGELVIEYKAVTDRATHVNLTSHSYFNLSGTASKNAAPQHELYIDADNVLVTDDGFIPTGAIQPVEGTTFDFRTWRTIGTQIPAGGYNTCFVLNHAGDNTVAQAGLRDTGSGIHMLVRTSLPGLLLYTGDYLGSPFIKNQGVCLETQFFPDSPNHPHFPSTLLLPGNAYNHQTVYQFLWDKNSK